MIVILKTPVSSLENLLNKIVKVKATVGAVKNMENDSSESDFDLAQFLGSDCESDSDIPDENDTRQSGNEIDQNLKKVIKMQIQNRLTYKTTLNTIDLMNQMPNSGITLPKSNKKLKKYMCKNANFEVLLHCSDFDEFVENGSKCSQCDRLFKKNSKKNNFIIYFPLEPQIRRLIDTFFNQIIQYINREPVDGVIRDVDDGILWKKIKAKHPNVINLGFTVNTDGANIHKSSNYSLWPIIFC